MYKRQLRGSTMLLGGLLFYVSDTLIALNSFGSLRLKYQDLAIWTLYAPAQALLIAGVWLLSAGVYLHRKGTRVCAAVPF